MRLFAFAKSVSRIAWGQCLCTSTNSFTSRKAEVSGPSRLSEEVGGMRSGSLKRWEV